MKSIFLFVNALYFSTLALSTPVDQLPKIDGLIYNSQAANSILPANNFHSIIKKNTSNERLSLFNSSKYLDDNCSKYIRAKRDREPDAADEKMIKETIVKTNDRYNFIDMTAKRSMQLIEEVNYNKGEINIKISDYNAYFEHAGVLYDVIHDVKYDPPPLLLNLLTHTFTLGLTLLSNEGRQDAFGCVSKKLSHRNIETINSSPTNFYYLIRNTSRHKISIDILGETRYFETNDKGVASFKLDSSLILNTPINNVTALNVKCESCKVDEFFGRSEDFLNNKSFSFDFNPLRRIENNKKLNEIFNADITDLGYSRLDKFGFLDFRKADLKFKLMQQQEKSYSKNLIGFLDYLSDEVDSNNSGRKMADVRSQRILAAEEREKKENIEKQRIAREDEIRSRQIRENHAKNYPFHAVVTCGFSGQHINILACFSGRNIDTHIELRNGKAYGLYKPFQLLGIGRESRQGFRIDLSSSFEFKAQNVNSGLILGVKIINTATNNVVFEKQVSDFGVIRVAK